jgi:hypothetical protein
MPVYEIEQYEVHVQKFQISAPSKTKAIKSFLDRGGEAVDNSLELVEVCDFLGMPLDEEPALAKALKRLGVPLDDGRIASIRDVEEVDV